MPKDGVASARLCRRTASLPLAYAEGRRRFRSPMPGHPRLNGAAARRRGCPGQARPWRNEG